MKINRYEIKFVLNELEFNEARYFLKNIKSYNSYPKRNVKTLYFDTLDFKSVKDNISGVSNRKKLRLRWDDKIEFIPELEIKNKFSRIGNKEKYKLSFLTHEKLKNLASGKINNEIFKNIRNIHKNESFFYNYYFPVLYVNYDREYIETKHGLRITIDNKINFKPITLNRNINFFKKINYEKRIMELKFSVELKNSVNELIRNLNLTPKRHSKYLAGLSKIGYAKYV